MSVWHARKLSAVSGCACALFAGCAAGPDYRPASADVPAQWQPQAPWQQAEPRDAALKGDWWALFGDANLDPLVEQALRNNQSLKIAAAHLEQARAQVTVARSYFYPDLSLSATAQRNRTSAN